MVPKNSKALFPKKGVNIKPEIRKEFGSVGAKPIFFDKKQPEN